MAKTPEDLVDIQAEAGVIASVLQKPDLLLFSEHLKPSHFSDTANGALYDAVSQLYEDGVERVDSFNLIGCINRSAKLKKIIDKEFTEGSISELIANSTIVARTEQNDFEILVRRLLELSFKREMYKKLGIMKNKCLDENVGMEELTQSINDNLDNSMLEYVIYEEPKLLSEICDDLWAKTKNKRREDGTYGFLSVIPQFAEHFSYESGELVLFSALPKRGKSILLMNEAINLALNHGKQVLYIDSELSTEAFQIRLMSYLSGIPVKMLKSGNFSRLSPEKMKTADNDIQRALGIIKKTSIRHIYKPGFEKEWLIATTKKLKKEGKIDVFIFDYFKGAATKGDDASSVYLGLGKAIDAVKNLIIGELDLIGIAACQSNKVGEVADSINLERSCSTLVFLENKTNRDIDQDGEQCGNMRFRVAANRNGSQMDKDEWIDANFDGDTCRFKECEQHVDDHAI